MNIYLANERIILALNSSAITTNKYAPIFNTNLLGTDNIVVSRSGNTEGIELYITYTTPNGLVFQYFVTDVEGSGDNNPNYTAAAYLSFIKDIEFTKDPNPLLAVARDHISQLAAYKAETGEGFGFDKMRAIVNLATVLGKKNLSRQVRELFGF